MRQLLLPGMKLKRWLLILFLGFIGLIIFVCVSFASQLAAFFTLLSWHLTNLSSLPIHKYSPKLIGELALLAASLILIILSIRGIVLFLINALIPEKKGRIWNLIYKHSDLSMAPRVVVLGGGTGLFSILRGLKNYTNNITAIVAMSDMGSKRETSTGKLRAEFGILPPGDVRQCLVALSDSGPLMSRLLQYRFTEGKGLKGHSFGNLLLTALTKITGSFDKALIEASRILAIRGKVLPVTLDKTHLCAELENGKMVEQEHNVESHKLKYKSEVARLFLNPPAGAYHEAVKEIRKADIVVLGPGSLYTSIIPTLLVKGIPEAIKESKARKIYVCNVMTQPGETDNYTASDHADKVIKYLGKGVLDYVVVNSARAPEQLYRKYRQQGSDRVRVDSEKLKKLNVKIIEADLLTKEDLLRHDSEKIAKVVLSLS